MKEKILGAWTWAKQTIGIPTMILLVLLGGYFFYASIRDWTTRLELAAQASRIDEYSRQSQAALDETNQHLASFEKNHQSTLMLLDTIQSMNENIKQLAANDRVINVQVDGLKNDYEHIRNQKRANNHSNFSLSERESRAIDTDAELYP